MAEINQYNTVTIDQFLFLPKTNKKLYNHKSFYHITYENLKM